jgi:hypothetical protein
VQPQGLRRVSLREENTVAFVPDLGVVDDRRCRVGDEPEAVPGSFGCGRGYGNRDRPDLKEVPGKLVHGVVDTHERLNDAAPPEVNRIDSAAHESKSPARAETIRNREGVEHAEVLGVEFSSARRQIHPGAVFGNWCCPKGETLRDACIPGVIAP